MLVAGVKMGNQNRHGPRGSGVYISVQDRDINHASEFVKGLMMGGSIWSSENRGQGNDLFLKLPQTR